MSITTRKKGCEFIKYHLNDEGKRPYSNNYYNTGLLEAINEIKNHIGHSLSCFEFGAGSGALAQQLLINGIVKSYMGCEIDFSAVQIARNSGIELINEAAETMVSKHSHYLSSNFNIFVYGDVLEHLIDPWIHLQLLNKLAAKNSYLVVSVPCFFHHSNLSGLGNFSFDYEEWGVMDFTHLRHFGLKNIRDMLELTGYRICNEIPLKPSFDPDGYKLFSELKDRLPTSIKLGRLSINVMTAEELLQISAYQFILCAQKK